MSDARASQTGNSPRMRGRAAELDATIAHVLSGWNVDVTGVIGAGRSTFLRAVSHRLSDRDWKVVQLTGLAALHEYPLVALHIRDIGVSRDGRHGVAAAVRGLCDLSIAGPLCVIVDDAEELDNASWAVILAAHADHEFPIVSARRPDSPAPQHHGLRVTLTPLGYEDLSAAMCERLGGGVALETMSRIFAKSAGIVGLANAIVDAVSAEGRFVRDRDGEWSVISELWTPALAGVAEERLAPLTGPERDAVGLIALDPHTDVEELRRTVETGVLESLERRELIRVAFAGSGSAVVISPPLIVEYLRRERSKIANRGVAVRLVTAHGEDRAGTGFASVDPGAVPPADDALLVRMIRERRRRTIGELQHLWQLEPSAGAAVRLLDELQHTDVVRERVDEILSGVVWGLGSDLDRAELVVRRAWWEAYTGRGLDAALTLLHADADMLGLAAPLIRVEAICLRRSLGDPIGIEEVAVTVPSGTPLAIVERAIDERFTLELMFGLVGDAAASLETIRGLRSQSTVDVRSHEAMLLIADGQVREAEHRARHAREQARRELGVGEIRETTHALMLALLFQGRYEEIPHLHASVLALGEPAMIPEPAFRAIQTIAALVEIRRGRSSTADELLRRVDEPGAGSRSAGISSAWVRAQLAASRADIDEAFAMLWESGLDRWGRGARLGGLVDLLAALDVRCDEVHLAEVERRARAVDSGLVTVLLALVRASFTESVDDLQDVAQRLEKLGLYGHARSAARAAVTLACGSVAERTSAESHVLEECEILAGADAERFARRHLDLTPREAQIARAASLGMSNADIAQQLVISVRTVESHLHHVMRKARVERRHELAAFSSLFVDPEDGLRREFPSRA
ncbi:LuxR C-terminal-related transcriptional regulator [Luethyella okanaganae]|uniref:LuxR C-terminal-related transcriptional regulator n=1 Tax=Luethyella okanaganae TaxID=69372 RepID=A0ABW1VE36_9MICO